MKFLPLLLILITPKFLSAATLTEWVANPNLGAGVDVVDYGTDANYTIALTNLTGNVAIQNLTLADWSAGNTNLEITNTGDPHTVSINNLDLAGDYFNMTIENGVTLIINGTTSSNKGSITIQAGGSIVFNNTVSLTNGSTITVNGLGSVVFNNTVTATGGTILVKNTGSMVFNNTFSIDGVTLTVDYGGFVDVNSTLTVNGGVNTMNINGNLEVNYLVANGGNQQIKIGSTGVFRVKNNANFNSGDAGSASFTVDGSGKFLINGNLDVGNTGGVYTVNGTLAVGGAITGNGASRLPHSPPKIYIGAPAAPILPIDLVSFKVFRDFENIYLSWQTATELNNDYFTLERSADGVNYETIATVAGAGTSMTAINYSFNDNKPLNGVSYYRLTQTDYDGKFEVFSPVSVSYLNESEIKIGNNVEAKQITIAMGGQMGLGLAKIYNVVGVLVKTIEITENYTMVNVNELPIGTYILVVSANKTQITKKIMVR